MSKPKLYSADFDIEVNRINEDLVWGMKGWIENDVPHYLFEVHFRVTDDPDEVPIYVREKVVGDPKGAKNLTVVPHLVERLTKLLTDEEHRREVAEYVRAQTGLLPIGHRMHSVAKDVTPNAQD